MSFWVETGLCTEISTDVRAAARDTLFERLVTNKATQSTNRTLIDALLVLSSQRPHCYCKRRAVEKSELEAYRYAAGMYRMHGEGTKECAVVAIYTHFEQPARQQQGHEQPARKPRGQLNMSELLLLAVKAKHNRRGLGLAMTKYIEQEAAAHHQTSNARLVVVSGKPALEFWQSEKVGVNQDFVEDPMGKGRLFVPWNNGIRILSKPLPDVIQTARGRELLMCDELKRVFSSVPPKVDHCDNQATEPGRRGLTEWQVSEDVRRAERGPSKRSNDDALQPSRFSEQQALPFQAVKTSNPVRLRREPSAELNKPPTKKQAKSPVKSVSDSAALRSTPKIAANVSQKRRRADETSSHLGTSDGHAEASSTRGKRQKSVPEQPVEPSCPLCKGHKIERGIKVNVQIPEGSRLCQCCSMILERKEYCPVCMNAWRLCVDEETAAADRMLECSKCKMWVHMACENQDGDPGAWEDNDIVYECPSCRGSKPGECLMLPKRRTNRKCFSCGGPAPSKYVSFHLKYNDPIDEKFCCGDCTKRFNADQYCPICAHLWDNDSRGMVQCDACDLWVHMACEGLPDSASNLFDGLPYSCPGCQGRTPGEGASIHDVKRLHEDGLRAGREAAARKKAEAESKRVEAAEKKKAEDDARNRKAAESSAAKEEGIRQASETAAALKQAKGGYNKAVREKEEKEQEANKSEVHAEEALAKADEAQRKFDASLAASSRAPALRHDAAQAQKKAKDAAVVAALHRAEADAASEACAQRARDLHDKQKELEHKAAESKKRIADDKALQQAMKQQARETEKAFKLQKKEAAKALRQQAQQEAAEAKAQQKEAEAQARKKRESEVAARKQREEQDAERVAKEKQVMAVQNVLAKCSTDQAALSPREPPEQHGSGETAVVACQSQQGSSTALPPAISSAYYECATSSARLLLLPISQAVPVANQQAVMDRIVATAHPIITTDAAIANSAAIDDAAIANSAPIDDAANNAGAAEAARATWNEYKACTQPFESISADNFEAKMAQFSEVLSTVYGDLPFAKLDWSTSITGTLVGLICAQNCRNSWSSIGYANLAATFPTPSGEPDWDLVRSRRLEDIVPCIWNGPYFYRKAQRIHDILERAYTDSRDLHSEESNGGSEREQTTSLEHLHTWSTERIRTYLMGFNGISGKSVSCLLLYRMGRVDFGVDANVLRVMTRLGWLKSIGIYSVEGISSGDRRAALRAGAVVPAMPPREYVPAVSPSVPQRAPKVRVHVILDVARGGRVGVSLTCVEKKSGPLAKPKPPKWTIAVSLNVTSSGVQALVQVQPKSKKSAVSMSQSTAATVPGAQRTRNRRCGSCEACARQNCGDCHYCRDMPKFGGEGKLRQPCVHRRCLSMHPPMGAFGRPLALLTQKSLSTAPDPMDVDAPDMEAPAPTAPPPTHADAESVPNLNRQALLFPIAVAQHAQVAAQMERMLQLPPQAPSTPSFSPPAYASPSTPATPAEPVHAIPSARSLELVPPRDAMPPSGSQPLPQAASSRRDTVPQTPAVMTEVRAPPSWTPQRTTEAPHAIADEASLEVENARTERPHDRRSAAVEDIEDLPRNLKRFSKRAQEHMQALLPTESPAFSELSRVMFRAHVFMITHGAVICGETPQCGDCPMRKHCEYGSLLYKEGRVKVSFSRRDSAAPTSNAPLVDERDDANGNVASAHLSHADGTDAQQSTEVQTRTASIDTEASTVAVSDDIDIVGGGDDVPIPMEDIDEPPGETMDLTINEGVVEGPAASNGCSSEIGPNASEPNASETGQYEGLSRDSLADIAASVAAVADAVACVDDVSSNDGNCQMCYARVVLDATTLTMATPQHPSDVTPRLLMIQGGTVGDYAKGRLLLSPWSCFKGVFPMHGTYFAQNEVFEDEAAGEVTLPLASLGAERRVYLGKSIEGVLRRRSASDLETLFRRSYVCIRRFRSTDQRLLPLVLDPPRLLKHNAAPSGLALQVGLAPPAVPPTPVSGAPTATRAPLVADRVLGAAPGREPSGGETVDASLTRASVVGAEAIAEEDPLIDEWMEDADEPSVDVEQETADPAFALALERALRLLSLYVAAGGALCMRRSVWRKVVQVLHPDRGGHTKVFQLVSELKGRIDAGEEVCLQERSGGVGDDVSGEEHEDPLYARIKAELQEAAAGMRESVARMVREL